jgi:hypothetical protein
MILRTDGRDPPGLGRDRVHPERWAELMVPTLAEIREFRPLVPPLLLGWILTLLTAWLTVPLVEVALAGDSGDAAPLVRGWMWAMAVLAPAILAGRALLWVMVTWALLTLASWEASLRSLFSIFLYGELLTTGYGLLVVLFFQWSVDPGAGGATFLDPLSLAAYVPSSHGPWGGVVKQLSLIQAAWVTFVGLAARQVLGLRPKGAWTLAVALWLGGVGVASLKILMNG